MPPDPLMPASVAIWMALVGLGAAAAIGLWRNARAVISGLTTIACVLLALGGVGVMTGGPVAAHSGGVLGLTLIDLRFDPLGGVFLIALGSVGGAASVAAFRDHHAMRSRFDAAAFPAFL